MAPARKRIVTVFTIGHSTRPLDDFVAALKAAGVVALADIRRYPRSRRHPHFNAEALGPALRGKGIAYHPFPALGGRRAGPSGDAPSPNDMWREKPFRNYADYALTPEFRAAFDALAALAQRETCAVMCAEAVWWRCHRRIVADYLLAAGFKVEHIFDAQKREAATLTPGAAPRPDGTVLYPAAEPRLL